MMMKVEKKHMNMVKGNKKTLIRVICCLGFFLSCISCGFKQSIHFKLPKSSTMNYRVVHDTIIHRMTLNKIKGPFKLESVIQHHGTAEFEVHSLKKKFLITLDSSYNVVKWYNYIEVY